MMTVGISTSYDEIRSAKEIEDYLTVARTCGAKGVSFFTGEPLVPFLDEVRKAGYFEEFVADRASR